MNILTAQTVAGPVSVDDLGATLTHEHVLVDARRFFTPDPDPLIALELQRGVVPENYGHLRRSLVNCLDDLIMDDDAVAVDELLRFRHRGGRTVFDVTSHGIRQTDHVRRVAKIAAATGLNIVTGTGAYTRLHHPDWVREATVDEMEERFVTELRVGVDGTDIRCGVIGEVGIGTPMLPEEERVLRACAAAQLRAGVPLIIHQTDSDGVVRHQVLKVLAEAGVRPQSIVMGHVGHIVDFDALLGVLESGCYVALDTFGLAGNWGLRELPTELQYARLVKAIIDAGHERRLVLSHDVGHKRLLRRHGGTGFDHLLADLPGLLAAVGTDPAVLDVLLRANPRQLFIDAAAGWVR
jgi:phosphotriesterase-related protein